MPQGYEIVQTPYKEKNRQEAQFYSSPGYQSVVQSNKQLQSPVTQNLSQSRQLQPSYSLEEFKRLKEQNAQQSYRIQSLEKTCKGLQEQLVDGQGQEDYIGQLQDQIKILIEENDRLYVDANRLGQALADQGFDVQQQSSIYRLQEETERLRLAYSEMREDRDAWKLRAEDLEQNLIARSLNKAQAPDPQSQLLVRDLEVKIQSLIEDNERQRALLEHKDHELYQTSLNTNQINKELQLENNQLRHENQGLHAEKQQVQEILKSHSKEIAIWKRRYDELDQKLSRLSGGGGSDAGHHKDRIEDLESKIKILIEENDKLNQVIHESIRDQEKSTDLEQRINNLLLEKSKDPSKNAAEKPDDEHKE